MARYVETQRYHQPYALVLLGLFSVLTLYHLLVADNVLVSLAILSIMAASWYYIRRLKCTIKVGKKKLKVYAPGSLMGRQKIAYSDIEEIEFFHYSPAEMWSGGMVNFSGNQKILDFGDRKGMRILLKDGQQFMLFSNCLYENRNELGLPKSLKVSGVEDSE